MQGFHRFRLLPIVFAIVSIGVSLSFGAERAGAADPKNRLFLAFDREATLVDSQWWEGSLVYADFDLLNTTVLRGTLAFHPYEKLEFGGSVGFGSSDTPPMVPDGSGATDLDVWAKWLFLPKNERTTLSAGGIITIPTGDDSAGLGYDAFSIAGFVSVRHELERVVLHGNAGLRTSNDGRFLGFDLDGQSTAFLGFGVAVPLSDAVSLIGEAQFDGKRFDESDNDVRLLGGINWRAFNTGMLRGAVTLGLDDGAPDFGMTFGYATQF